MPIILPANIPWGHKLNILWNHLYQAPSEQLHVDPGAKRVTEASGAGRSSRATRGETNEAYLILVV